METHLQTILKENSLENWYIVRDMFSEEEIQKIEKDVRDLPQKDATTLGGEVGQGDYRISTVKWLPQFDSSNWKWIYHRMWKWAKIANDENWNFDIMGWKDSPQYTHYAFPDGHYDYHMDCCGEGINHRKISMSILLQEAESGGTMQLLYGREPYSIDLSRGDAVIFPSFVLHRVTRILSGERKSLVSWISGNPYK